MAQMVIILSDDSVEGDKKHLNQVVEDIGKFLLRHDVVIQPQLNAPDHAKKYLYTNNIIGAGVDTLREEVEGLPGVEAAYLKPMDELP